MRSEVILRLITGTGFDFPNLCGGLTRLCGWRLDTTAGRGSSQELSPTSLPASSRCYQGAVRPAHSKEPPAPCQQLSCSRPDLRYRDIATGFAATSHE